MPSLPELSEFRVTGLLWHWRGPSPYYFVRVPPEASADLTEDDGVHVTFRVATRDGRLVRQEE